MTDREINQLIIASLINVGLIAFLILQGMGWERQGHYSDYCSLPSHRDGQRNSVDEHKIKGFYSYYYFVADSFSARALHCDDVLK